MLNDERNAKPFTANISNDENDTFFQFLGFKKVYHEIIRDTISPD